MTSIEAAQNEAKCCTKHGYTEPLTSDSGLLIQQLSPLIRQARVEQMQRMILFLCAVVSGCVCHPIEGENGEQHHVIIGLGIVTTQGRRDEEQVEARRSHLLGIDLSLGEANGIRAGYAFEATVVVPDNTENYCAEIAGKPFGTLKVESCGGIAKEYKLRETEKK